MSNLTAHARVLFRYLCILVLIQLASLGVQVWVTYRDASAPATMAPIPTAAVRIETVIVDPVVLLAAPYIHGIVIDENAEPVVGGKIRLYRNQAEKPYRESFMVSHSFGWSLRDTVATYRIEYAHGWYVVDWYEQRRYGGATIETDTFTVPGDLPVGDIVIHVRMLQATRTPTLTRTLWPTVTARPTATPGEEPTRTPRPSPTVNPAISYFDASPHVQGTLMAYTDLMLAEYVPASCFEIASAEKGCPLAVTEAWVAQIDGECWKFRPFSCPGEDGIELAARCESPCKIAIITNGHW